MGRKPNLTAPLKQELYELYVVQRKTYREIMQYYGINNARAIKKWLEMYEIPIRHGSEAIKIQWENNTERRKQQGAIFQKTSKGNTRRRLSENQLKEKYTKIGYKYCGREIIDGYTWVMLRCENNHTFTQTLRNYGDGCPKCLESKAEKEVAAILDSLGLTYSRQYRIAECKNERPLPFDFAIFDNDKLLFLIEYDGETHYKDIYGNLEKQMINDSIKTKYCMENGIKLLRIPYYKDKRQEIENYINKVISSTI